MSDRAERMATITLPREVTLLGEWCLELLTRIEKLEAEHARLRARFDRHLQFEKVRRGR